MGTSPDLEIVTWMNQPSPHQDYLSAELIRQGATLTVIYASRLRAERQQIGWEVDDLAPSASVLPSRFSFVEALRIVRRHSRAIHIVNGIWAEPLFFVVVLCCLLQGIRYCIYSEAPASMTTISFAASLKRNVQRQIVRIVGRKADSLLAISWLAEEAFAALGFPKRKIYRFGYFENVPDVETTCSPQNSRRREVITREQLAHLLACSEVSVSPSSHDVTSNTLLEAMACGCFPVVGDVDSVREWIADGENGLICDESDARSLADCVVRPLRDPTRRSKAAEMNRKSVQLRANYANGMSAAEKLYEMLAGAAGVAAAAD